MALFKGWFRRMTDEFGQPNGRARLTNDQKQRLKQVGAYLFLLLLLGFGLGALNAEQSATKSRLNLTAEFSFFDPAMLLAIGIPLLVVTVWQGVLHRRPWAQIWYLSGVPLGVVISALNMVTLLQLADSPDDYSRTIANSLLAIAYGGLISIIGRQSAANDFNDTPETEKSLTATDLWLIPFALAAPVIYAATLSDPATFIYAPAISVFMAFLLFPLLLNARPDVSRLQTLSESSIVATLGCVLCGLIAYYDGDGIPHLMGPPTAVGLLGLIYGGGTLFMLGVMASPRQLKEANFPLRIWHLLEIYGLWVLMCFAPMALKEAFIR